MADVFHRAEGPKLGPTSARTPEVPPGIPNKTIRQTTGTTRTILIFLIAIHILFSFSSSTVHFAFILVMSIRAVIAAVVGLGE
jgi:hypothetical protein